ncbi:MAG: outer membrane beta-barrel protein [Bacteroidota bacterium]
MNTFKLGPILSAITVCFFLFGQSPLLRAQHHELALSPIRTDGLSPIFEPSLRYTLSFNNLGLRAIYAWHNTDQRFGSGTAYPSSSKDKMYYGALGLQYTLPFNRWELYAIADLGYSEGDYTSNWSNGKIRQGGASWGEISTISLRPGLGLKYRLFKQLYLGLEFQQALNWNHRIGTWESYYYDPNPSVGLTTKDSGQTDSKYFRTLSMLSGLIISWRF